MLRLYSWWLCVNLVLSEIFYETLRPFTIIFRGTKSFNYSDQGFFLVDNARHAILKYLIIYNRNYNSSTHSRRNYALVQVQIIRGTTHTCDGEYFLPKKLPEITFFCLIINVQKYSCTF